MMIILVMLYALLVALGLALIISTLAGKRVPKQEPTPSPKCNHDVWIPISAQPLHGDIVAYDQTVVLKRCRCCGVHATQTYPGNWSLSDFLTNEWSVESLEKMIR